MTPQTNDQSEEVDVTEEVIEIHGTPQSEHGTPQLNHGTPQLDPHGTPQSDQN